MTVASCSEVTGTEIFALRIWNNLELRIEDSSEFRPLPTIQLSDLTPILLAGMRESTFQAEMVVVAAAALPPTVRNGSAFPKASSIYLFPGVFWRGSASPDFGRCIGVAAHY